MRSMGLGEGWPLRSSVETAWREVIAGRRTRESVHDWAAPWVEGRVDAGRPADARVESGLQHLHELDMTSRPEAPDLVGHGGPGDYVLSDDEVAKQLEHWLGGCREYDDDPAGFAERARERARRSR